MTSPRPRFRAPRANRAVSRQMTRAVGGLAASGLGVLAYASLVERRWYALRHETVPVLRPAALRPLRVLHLSDLHLTPRQHGKMAFVRSCRDVGADVVVLTGDVLGHPDAVRPAVALLAELARGIPAVAVLGSNDFHGPVVKNPLAYLTNPSMRRFGTSLDTDGLVRGLREAGWHVLENEHRRLDSVAGPLDVVGLGDAHIGRDRPQDVDWSTPPDPVAVRLGVTHSPYRRSLAQFDQRGFDLALAGHTHGGQVRVPGVGALVANCDLPTRQARGLSRFGALWLHVSAGLGTAVTAPVRFACRPDATVLDLVEAPPG